MKAQIFNFKCWVSETDPGKLYVGLTKLLRASDFKIMNVEEHYFAPYGYTALWLISESHLAVHTWPEENRSYIELSSCNQAKQEKFINNFKLNILGESSTNVF